MFEETAILIPALNEEEALSSLLASIRLERFHSVIVIDNGSTDRTAQIARRNGALVLFEDTRGYGAACLAGIEALSRCPHPPAVVVFINVGNPEDPLQIPALLGEIVEGADLVLGVRVHPSGKIGNPFPHARWGTRLVLAIVRVLYGHKFRDLPPLRAIRFSELCELDLDERSWGWTLQMQLRAAKQKLNIVEMEIPHCPRQRGKSKISGSLPTSMKVGVRMMVTVFRERTGRRMANCPLIKNSPY